MSSYFAIITKSKDGYFVAEFPDFPEAFTQGKDLEECVFMAQDILNVSLEAYTLERRSIPKPSSIAEIKKRAKELLKEDAEYTDLSFEPLFQYFKAPEMSQKPVKVMVSFPKSALERIDQKAERMGLTRSNFLTKAGLAYE